MQNLEFAQFVQIFRNEQSHATPKFDLLHEL